MPHCFLTPRLRAEIHLGRITLPPRCAGQNWPVQFWQKSAQLLTAPIIFVTPGAASYVENAPPVTVDTGISLFDPDGSLITGVTVKITNFSTGDQLNFTDQLGITGNYDSMTGILTLSGIANEVDYSTAAPFNSVRKLERWTDTACQEYRVHRHRWDRHQRSSHTKRQHHTAR